MHSLHFMTVHLEDQLTDLEAARIVCGSILMDVDDARQWVFCVGATLYRDPQNRFRFLHRDMQIAAVVRYNIGAVLYAAMTTAQVLVPLAMAMGIVVRRGEVVAVLSEGESLHRLVAADVATQ